MMIEVAAVQPFIVLLVLYNVNADVNTNAHTDNVFPYNQEHFLKEYFSLLHPVLMSIISGKYFHSALSNYFRYFHKHITLLKDVFAFYCVGL